MKSSCRAPALNAMAFHPFCTGTDAHFHWAAGVSHRTDDAGDYGANFGSGGQQALQDLAYAVDDAVLDLEPVLGGAQAH